MASFLSSLAQPSPALLGAPAVAGTSPLTLPFTPFPSTTQTTPATPVAPPAQAARLPVGPLTDAQLQALMTPQPAPAPVENFGMASAGFPMPGGVPNSQVVPSNDEVNAAVRQANLAKAQGSWNSYWATPDHSGLSWEDAHHAFDTLQGFTPQQEGQEYWNAYWGTGPRTPSMNYTPQGAQTAFVLANSPPVNNNAARDANQSLQQNAYNGLSGGFYGGMLNSSYATPWNGQASAQTSPTSAWGAPQPSSFQQTSPWSFGQPQASSPSGSSANGQANANPWGGPFANTNAWGSSP